MTTKTVTHHAKSPQGKQIAIPNVEMNYGTILTSSEKITYGDLEGTELADDQVVVAVSANSWLKVGDHVRIDFRTFQHIKKPGKNDVGSNVELVIPYDVVGNRKYLFLKEGQLKFKLIDGNSSE